MLGRKISILHIRIGSREGQIIAPTVEQTSETRAPNSGPAQAGAQIADRRHPPCLLRQPLEKDDKKGCSTFHSQTRVQSSHSDTFL